MSADSESTTAHHTCEACGQVVDVSALGPFEQMACPECGAVTRVRVDFDHYRIEGLRGVGGMSQVFTALDTQLDRLVALKVLNRDNSSKQERIAQFEREARLTASVNHPNVVRVYGVGRVSGNFYIAMEMVDGASLEDLLADEKKLAEPKVLELAIQTVEGLNAAHKIGLIHRDIKPGNILVTGEGRAKLVDFGLALVFEKDVDDSEEMWATPYYVAPEKLDHRPEDFRSDIYSLGATLFHLLAGRPPHDLDSASVDELRVAKAVPVRLGTHAPMISGPTQEVINRMIAHDPDGRPSSYGALLDELHGAKDALLDSLGSLRGGARAVRREQERKQRIQMLVGVAVAAVLVGGLVLWRVAGGGAAVDDVVNGEDEAEMVFDWGDAGGSLQAGSAGERFLRAREALVDGRHGEALDGFKMLAEGNAGQARIAAWSVCLGAMAAMVEGAPGEARELMQNLASGPLASDPGVGAENMFFASLARVFGNPWAVDEADIREFERAHPEQWPVAFALLGLKNWEHGRFGSAAAVFETLAEGALPEGVAWMAGMEPLWRERVRDATAFETMRSLGDFANSAEGEAALQRAEEMAGAMAEGGRLARMAERRIEQIREEVDGMRREEIAEAERGRQERLEAEWADLRQAVDEGSRLLSELRFEEALLRLGRSSPSFPETIAARELLEWHWRGGSDFVEGLIDDLNEHGYRGRLQLARDGVVMASVTVTRATSSSLVMEGRAGALTAQLALIPAEELARIGGEMLGNHEAAALADRRRMLALFARQAGLRDVFREQIGDGTELGEEFMEKLGRLVEVEQALGISALDDGGEEEDEEEEERGRSRESTEES